MDGAEEATTPEADRLAPRIAAAARRLAGINNRLSLDRPESVDAALLVEQVSVLEAMDTWIAYLESRDDQGLSGDTPPGSMPPPQPGQAQPPPGRSSAESGGGEGGGEARGQGATEGAADRGDENGDGVLGPPVDRGGPLMDPELLKDRQRLLDLAREQGVGAELVRVIEAYYERLARERGGDAEGVDTRGDEDGAGGGP